MMNSHQCSVVLDGEILPFVTKATIVWEVPKTKDARRLMADLEMLPPDITLKKVKRLRVEVNTIEVTAPKKKSYRLRGKKGEPTFIVENPDVVILHCQRKNIRSLT